MAISVHVQMSPGCSHGQRTIALVRDVLAELAPDARIETIDVRTVEDAARRAGTAVAATRHYSEAAWGHRWQARLHWSPEQPEERDAE